MIAVNDTFTPAITWTAAAFPINTIVYYNGTYWFASSAAVAGNVPGVSSVWFSLGSGPINAGSGAANGDLGSHAGEIGATWTATSGSASGIVNAAGHFRQNAASGTAHYLASGTPSTTSYDVFCDLLPLDHSGNWISGVSASVNGSGATLSCYFARYDIAIGGGTGTFELYKYNNSGYTLLGSAQAYNATLGPSTVFRMKLSIRPNSQALYYSTNGGETWTATTCVGSDASITQTKVCGVHAYGNITMSDTVGLHLDNFTVTDSNMAAVLPNTIQLSPSNWNVQSTFARTYNTGAYLRAYFTGTSVALNFNLANNTDYLPVLKVRVDGGQDGNWTTYVESSTIVAATNLNSSNPHLVEARLGYVSRFANAWNASSPGTACEFTGLTLDNGSTAAAPSQYAHSVIVFADSTVDAFQMFDWREELGVELGVVGFDGLGILYNNQASDGVPVVSSSYLLQEYGVNRNWSNTSLVVFNHGQNDSQQPQASFTSALLSIVQDIRANRSTGVPVLLTAPYTSSQANSPGGNGTANQSAGMQSVVATIGSPTVTFWDKGASINPATETIDGAHPTIQAFFGKVLPAFHDKVQGAVTIASATAPGVIAMGIGL